tara:strand:+ start:342 stop:875 length:534 start_codon:yes stop_codon:yes gene_type:complete
MKKLLILTILSAFFISCVDNKSDLVIGSTLGNDGESSEIVVGDTDNQQVWIDYIDAHNNRELDKIAEINTDDWVGYAPNGNVIKGNEAHMEFLDEWFKSTANPKWTVKWMIANKGENVEGNMQEFLTTGNDMTFTDEEGNESVENLVHDIMFEDGKIKTIFVYSRTAPSAPTEESGE